MASRDSRTHRSSSAVAVTPLKTSWKKRQLERAEKKALKEFEQELKEAAQREREVGEGRGHYL